jgi:hypothetical protein
MTFLQRLFRRKPTHAEWLAAHPGKESTKAASPSIDAEEQQRMRTQMEGELDQQRATREDRE